MKKLFLIISIILWQLSCLAIELTKAEIMPKKLLFAELPKDYPPEINELFEFYYKTCKELYSRINDINDRVSNDSILEKYIAEFTHNEIRKFAYWEWLAKNHITHYFFEYHDLHNWMINNVSDWDELLPYAHDIKSLLFYPEGIEQAVQQGSLIYWLISIRQFIYHRYNNEIHEFSILDLHNSVSRVPIAGKLIKSTNYKVKNEFITTLTYIREYQILEFDTGETIETVLLPLFIKVKPKLVIGEKYLVLLGNIPESQKIALSKSLNVQIPKTAFLHTGLFKIVNEVVIVKENWSPFEHFFNVDKLNSREQKIFNTPLDVFWERYNHFHKRILKGK